METTMRQAKFVARGLLFVAGAAALFVVADWWNAQIGNFFELGLPLLGLLIFGPYLAIKDLKERARFRREWQASQNAAGLGRGSKPDGA
jgi:hypothetical protein